MSLRVGTWSDPAAWGIVLRNFFFIFFALCASVFAQETLTLDAEMEQLRAQHDLPALAGIAMIDGRVRGVSAVGVRKIGAPEKVTDADKWHIGSCTKSMTATLAAMFVEQGKLKWGTTVGEVFPEWRGQMKPEWEGVTMEQLLEHRSGAPHDAPPDLWSEAWEQTGTPTEQRLAFVHGLVTRPPEAPPGTQYIYSNQGYAIAGAMLERILHKPWEELMRAMLFEPLGMKSAGFGAPAAIGQINQPWGHVMKDGMIKPVPPGPGGDNPPAIGPAGTVHCSLVDFALYADLHARGQFADTTLLRKESFIKLHTAAHGQDYACGWIVASRPWAGGAALTHVGSNAMFVTDVWIAPERKSVFISATNIAGKGADAATDEVIGVLIRRYLE